MKKLLISLSLLICCNAFAGKSIAPSFNCNSDLSSAQKTICENRRLSALDAISNLYMMKVTRNIRPGIAFREHMGRTCRGDINCINMAYADILVGKLPQQDMIELMDAYGYHIVYHSLNDQKDHLFETFSNGSNKIGVIYTCRSDFNIDCFYADMIIN